MSEEEPDYQFPIEVVYDSEEGSNTVVINTPGRIASCRARLPGR